MILQDLYDYYNILDSEGVKDLPKENTSMQKISFALVLSKEGKLSGIIDVREQSGKKVVPNLMVVPEQPVRKSNILPYFLCDNAKYVLGIGDKEGNPCFNSFKEMHNRYLGEESPICEFINSWIPEEYESNNIINQYIKDLTSSCNIVFKVEGETGYYHEKNENLEKWKRGLVSNDDEIMQCLITGRDEPIARIHTPIKGIWNAQAAGASIVSFNDKAFNSYGKEASYNAPISKSAMFKYTTVLNYLIRSEKNTIIIGDNTVVFWAEKKGMYEDLLLELINPTYDKEEGKESLTTDKKTRDLTKDILMKYSMGLKLNQDKYDIDLDIKVHILGLSPNNARLSIAFYEVNTFEYFTRKLAQHYNDLNIIGNNRSIPIWMILSETIPKTSNDKKVSPVLSKSLMNSIFRGVIYPSSLYNSIISRTRADKDINYKRAAIIKACLNRRYRLHKEKEAMTVSLNEESKSIPYQLGRLFAVLEKAQKEAIPDLKTTIKDSYFTSASATPASVFPILIKLSFHHTKKAEYGTNLEIKKNKIIDKIDVFPKHLSLEEQGEFILGYYHQNEDFYKPQGGK